MLEILLIVLRHHRKLMVLPVAIGFAFSLAAVLSPPRYTAEASFMPQTQQSVSGQLSQLSGVAAQFGIDVPSGQVGQSPQFYGGLLQSRRILDGAVSTAYQIVNASDTIDGDLVTIFDVDAETPAAARATARRRLEESLNVDTNEETGVVNIGVTTPWPHLSHAVAERLIDLVNRFNLEVRQSQAAAQAAFVQDRLTRAREELRAVEDTLERFVEQNRNYQSSASLRFQYQRLQRRVDLKQQVFTSLATRYEEAQISKVRNTPVITVVTPAEIPAKPDSSGLLLKVCLGLFLGAMLALIWALTEEFLVNARNTQPDRYSELQNLLGDFTDSIRRMTRKMSGLSGGT